jgi:hypothetical protein
MDRVMYSPRNRHARHVSQNHGSRAETIGLQCPVGESSRDSVFPSRQTAGPSPALPQISCPPPWRWRTLCGFLLRKPHTSPWAVPRCRKSGSAPLGMTNFSAVAHLCMSGGGWTESKKLVWTSPALSPFDKLRAGSSTSSHGSPGQAGQALRDSMWRSSSHADSSERCPSQILVVHDPSPFLAKDGALRTVKIRCEKHIRVVSCVKLWRIRFESGRATATFRIAATPPGTIRQQEKVRLYYLSVRRTLNANIFSLCPCLSCVRHGCMLPLRHGAGARCHHPNAVHTIGNTMSRCRHQDAQRSNPRRYRPQL